MPLEKSKLHPRLTVAINTTVRDILEVVQDTYGVRVYDSVRTRIESAIRDNMDIPKSTCTGCGWCCPCPCKMCRPRPGGSHEHSLCLMKSDPPKTD